MILIMVTYTIIVYSVMYSFYFDKLRCNGNFLITLLDVSYYLSKMEKTSCDQVCQLHDLNCTVENHGFRNDNVLKIFTSLLGAPCQTGQNDAYWRTGPIYFYNNSTKTGWCSRWKGIPNRINCGAVPTFATRKRLCPCVGDIGKNQITKVDFLWPSGERGRSMVSNYMY